jgi:hypothetical protein
MAMQDQEKGGNPLDLSLEDMAISSVKEHLAPRRLASPKHLDHLSELLCCEAFCRRLRHHAAVHADSVRASSHWRGYWPSLSTSSDRRAIATWVKASFTRFPPLPA